MQIKDCYLDKFNIQYKILRAEIKHWVAVNVRLALVSNPYSIGQGLGSTKRVGEILKYIILQS